MAVAGEQISWQVQGYLDFPVFHVIVVVIYCCSLFRLHSIGAATADFYPIGDLAFHLIRDRHNTSRTVCICQLVLKMSLV